MSLKLIKHGSVRIHVTLLIVFASVFSIATVGFLTQLSTKKLLQKEALSNLTQQVLLQSERFESQIQNLTATKQFLETILHEQLKQQPRLDSTSVVKIKNNLLPLMIEWGKHSKPFSMWVVFESSKAKGKHTVSLYDSNNDGIYEREEEYDILAENLRMDKFNWWTKAVKHGEVWVNPYYWDNWDRQLITYSKAIYHRGELVACIGSDIDFTSFLNLWQNLRFYNTGYLVLSDNEFNIILHPSRINQNAKDFLPTNVFNALDSATKKEKQGIILEPWEKNDRMLAYNRLSNGWLLVASVPTSEIMAPLSKMRQSIVILAIIAVLIAFVTGYFMSQLMQKPISDLVLLFDKSAEGHLNHRWKDRGITEIDIIGTHFNKFMTKMQLMIMQLHSQQQSLKIALQKANESDELKSAFLGNLSHEIRTPLYAITGFASLLDDPDLNDQEKQNFIQIISRNSDKLLKFVDNIMVFSQLEQKQLAFNPVHVETDRLFEELYLSFQSSYQSSLKQIIWPDTSSINKSKVFVDLGLFKIVADALIDNAWKFTHSGDIRITYHFTQNHFVFSVSDSGIGIPSEYHELIFNKFFKYKNIDDSMLYEGVGMGLCIAKGIVALHRGNIKLESTTNRGSTFEVLIPSHQKTSNDIPLSDNSPRIFSVS